MHYPHPIEIAARRRKIAVISAALMLVAGYVVYLCWPTGPYYHGRSLNAWLQDFTNPLAHVHHVNDLRDLDFSGKMTEAEEAIKAIGTNAVPTLLELTQARDSGFKKVCLSAMGQGNSLRDYFTSEKEKHKMALSGFLILKTNALSAVPKLNALTKHSDPIVRQQAFEMLVVMSVSDLKTFLPVVVSYGRDPDPENHQKALEHIRMFVPVLSRDEARALGVYDAFPELQPQVESAAH